MTAIFLTPPNENTRTPLLCLLDNIFRTCFTTTCILMSVKDKQLCHHVNVTMWMPPCESIIGVLRSYYIIIVIRFKKMYWCWYHSTMLYNFNMKNADFYKRNRNIWIVTQHLLRDIVCRIQSSPLRKYCISLFLNKTYFFWKDWQIQISVYEMNFKF